MSRHAFSPTKSFLPGKYPGRLVLAALSFFLGGKSADAAEIPSYFATALAHFSADVPREWAYTLSVERGAESSVEAFDPSQPAGSQWTLLKHNGRPATPDEAARYARYRETNNASSVTRATFARGDLDYSSAQIVRENSARATIRCRFRTDATEPMLAHLELFVVVAKDPATVQKTTLQLLAPYSPVTAMTMKELEIATTFSPPGSDHPGLPLVTVSHFRGRALWFWSVDEDLRVTYANFRRVTPAVTTPPAG